MRLTTTTRATWGSRIRAISPALPVTSKATTSVPARLAANSSSDSGLVAIRPAERTVPASAIATSQKSRCTSIPIALTTATLLALDGAGAQVGKRHRRIRAHSTTGPVAGAATENPGLAAHQS
jgi:hypothetical protein